MSIHIQFQRSITLIQKYPQYKVSVTHIAQHKRVSRIFLLKLSYRYHTTMLANIYRQYISIHLYMLEKYPPEPLIQNSTIQIHPRIANLPSILQKHYSQPPTNIPSLLYPTPISNAHPATSPQPQNPTTLSTYSIPETKNRKPRENMLHI